MLEKVGRVFDGLDEYETLAERSRAQDGTTARDIDFEVIRSLSRDAESERAPFQ